MEPAGLNSLSDDSRLEELLRQPTAPALPDDGFSTRVLAALPPRPAARSWRAAFGLAGAVAGLAVAWRGGSLSGFNALTGQMHQVAGELLPVLTNPWLATAVIIALASAAIACWPKLASFKVEL